MSDQALIVYWQPGCSSCLQAKELLRRLGIPFESVNVRTDPQAMTELARLGVRTVPVVRRGEALCFAQDLDELAAFVGESLARERLAVDTLGGRLDALLGTAAAFAAALPDAALQRSLPGRENRRIIDLAYHVFVIAEAFLDTAAGGRLDYEYYERLPPPALHDGAAIAGFGRDVRTRLQAWRAGIGPATGAQTLQTYFGNAPLVAVLERTCWHTAQHARQLESLLAQLSVDAGVSLGPEALAGLPLPEAVWDDEVDMQLQARSAG